MNLLNRISIQGDSESFIVPNITDESEDDDLVD